MSEGEVQVRGEIPRPGPREALRQKVEDSADELADAVVDAALTGKGVPAGRLALSAIEKADPSLEATVTFPTTIEEVNQLDLEQLRALAQIVRREAR